MKVLMVCLGNICRSPLAEGIMSDMVQKENLDWKVDSAGTGSWHIGEQPHHGSIQIANQNGLDISQQRARKFSTSDFNNFDLILVMDSSNYNDVIRLAENQIDKEKVRLILNYSYPNMNMAVPDPYFTGNFNEVFDLLKEACEKVLRNIKG